MTDLSFKPYANVLVAAQYHPDLRQETILLSEELAIPVIKAGSSSVYDLDEDKLEAVLHEVSPDSDFEILVGPAGTRRTD